jgi:poly(A) polymerase
LLTIILPELAPVAGTAPQAPPGGLWQKTLHMLERLEAPSFELALAALFAGVGSDDRPDAAAQTMHELCRRLRLSNDEREHSAWLVAMRTSLRDASHLPAARFRRLMAEPWITDLIALRRVECLAEGGSLADVEYCENYLDKTPPEEIDPPPFVTGDDLLRLRLKPGPEFRRLLDRVRDAQLEGTIRTRDEALVLVERLLKELQGGSSS